MNSSHDALWLSCAALACGCASCTAIAQWAWSIADEFFNLMRNTMVLTICTKLLKPQRTGLQLPVATPIRHSRAMTPAS
eukprot:5094996-Pleurochrysis_carterae.AAC.1